MKKIKAFDVINILLMILLGAITLIPVLTVVAKAFSDPTYVIAGRVGILPKGFQLDTIKYVLNKPEFLNAFKNSVFVTGVGTIMAMFMTVSAAYPLSKPELRGRKFFLYIFVFVMLFGAGMVPSYLLYNSLHLLNTRWALIFASGFSVFNLLVVKNYFEQLPESIEPRRSSYVRSCTGYRSAVLRSGILEQLFFWRHVYYQTRVENPAALPV